MINPGLSDRVVLVTGANSGIGAATALAFAGQGAVVAVHYLGSAAGPPPRVKYEHDAPGRPAAETVVRRIAEAGGRAAAFAVPTRCDVSRSFSAQTYSSRSESGA